MTRPTVIKNVRIIDPSQGMDETGTIVVKDGRIAAAGKAAQNQGTPEGADIVDGTGLVAAPGLVDARVFVGEPGAEHRETIESAIARGGRRRDYDLHHDARHRSGDRRHRTGRIRAEDGARQGARACASGRRPNQGPGRHRDDGVRPACGKPAPSPSPTAARRSTTPQVLRRAMTYAREFGAVIALRDPRQVSRRRRGDERGTARKLARPVGHAARGGGHSAGARPAARHPDARGLPRRPDLGAGIGRGDTRWPAPAAPTSPAASRSTT
jgi:hypothetical protein